ncbi:MAG: phage tail sheath subtilisin-like domain-containing protein, partial [Planctomycetota bacterium]
WNVTTQTVTPDDDRVGETTAGVGVPTLTTILANLAAVETHYLVTSGYGFNGTTGVAEGTTIAALKDHAIAKADTNSMLRCIIVSADKNTTTQSVALGNAVDTNDAERVTIAACEDSPSWEGDIAAQYAIALAYGYRGDDDVARPKNDIVLSDIVPPATTGDKYTPTERNTLMAGGITPLVAKDDTNVQIIRAISVRMDVQDPQDISVIEIMDEFRERCEQKYTANIVNYKLKQNGQTIYTNKAVTPDSVADLFKDVAFEMEREDKLQGIEDTISQWVATQPSLGRVNIEIPCPIVPGLHIVDSTFNLVLSF